MNPIELPPGHPHRIWLRLGLGAVGLVFLVSVVRVVDWRQFRTVFASLRWSWVLVSLLVGLGAVAARVLRLTWILGERARFSVVWRATALGYLGKSLLPMGGGELVKIGTIQALLDVPAAAAVTGVVLDRLFDLLGVGLLIALMAGAGIALQLRAGALWLGSGLLIAAALATWLVLQPRFRRVLDAHASRLPRLLRRALDGVTDTLGSLKRPGHLGRLLAVQIGVTALDLIAIYLGLLAFPFGPDLPLLVSVRLAVYLMVGSALPLLPGGAGILQVACLLALQPAGVTSAGAFAYSLVAQGTALGLAFLQGGMAALWPLPAKGPADPPGPALGDP